MKWTKGKCGFFRKKSSRWGGGFTNAHFVEWLHRCPSHVQVPIMDKRVKDILYCELLLISGLNTSSLWRTNLWHGLLESCSKFLQRCRACFPVSKRLGKLRVDSRYKMSILDVIRNRDELTSGKNVPNSLCVSVLRHDAAGTEDHCLDVLAGDLACRSSEN